MEVAPNNVLHTSPDILAEVENIFNKRYPMANAPTESIAMAASPFIFAFCPVFKSNTAVNMVTGIIKNVLLEICKIDATAIAPNATCESPSPI